MSDLIAHHPWIALPLYGVTLWTLAPLAAPAAASARDPGPDIGFGISALIQFWRQRER